MTFNWCFAQGRAEKSLQTEETDRYIRRSPSVIVFLSPSFCLIHRVRKPNHPRYIQVFLVKRLLFPLLCQSTLWPFSTSVPVHSSSSVSLFPVQSHSEKLPLLLGRRPAIYSLLISFPISLTSLFVFCLFLAPCAFSKRIDVMEMSHFLKGKFRNFPSPPYS